AMSLSSFCVVSNALRLSFFDPYAVSATEKKNAFEKERKDGANKKISLANKSSSQCDPCCQETKRGAIHALFKVQGMMCQHCENHVQSALMTLPEMIAVTADHTKGIVALWMKKPISEESIRSVIGMAGYHCTERLNKNTE
ncbi:MAG: cation transporter, partial [Desulfovibrio sp.]|nr:cation transporter [Desulfovibrio sp.]